jgi:hypothetical protein
MSTDAPRTEAETSVEVAVDPVTAFEIFTTVAVGVPAW